jgi:flagellar hook-basal body complex protein FliE
MASNSPLGLGNSLGKTVSGFSNSFNFDWNSAKDAGKTTLQGGVQAFAKELNSQENALGGVLGSTGSSTGNAIAGIQGAFKEQVRQLEAVQSEATVAMQDYATGGEIPLHQVMMRVNRAELSLQLATQVRNKILSAYQEVSHMQI